MRRLALWGAIVALLLSTGGGAEASIGRALDLAELVRRADRIALVTALDRQSSWDARGRIVTDTRLRVDRSLKGGPAEAPIVVRCFGGEIGEIGMRVEGEPSFEPGARALVFLRAQGAGPMRPVGLSQGVLPVRELGGREMVLPGGAGLLLQRREGGELRSAPSALTQARALDAFLLELADRIEASGPSRAGDRP